MVPDGLLAALVYPELADDDVVCGGGDFVERVMLLGFGKVDVLQADGCDAGESVRIGIQF